MSQVRRHIPIDTLDPTQHRSRRIHALEPNSLEIQDRRENRLHGYEMRQQDLRNAIVRVDEGLEFVVCPARGRVVQQHEGRVGFYGPVVCVVDGADEDLPVRALPVGEVEELDVAQGEGGEVEIFVVDAIELRGADAAPHSLQVAVFAERLGLVSVCVSRGDMDGMYSRGRLNLHPWMPRLQR